MDFLNVEDDINKNECCLLKEKCLTFYRVLIV